MGPTDRVSISSLEKMEVVQKYLTASGINPKNYELKLVAFKAEQILNIFAKSEGRAWSKIVEYEFCTMSGKLGPKLKEGDHQIPEGFYKINRFNPRSKFYLSLGLNYPTAMDMKLADPNQPGKDIFIHGGCQSVGCIPITDDKIKELYLLAKNAVSDIEVVILPFEFKQQNLSKYAQEFGQWKDFWESLWNTCEKLPDHSLYGSFSQE